MFPVRDLMQTHGIENYLKWDKQNMRAVTIDDIIQTITYVNSSVCMEEIERYLLWNSKFGTSQKTKEILLN